MLLNTYHFPILSLVKKFTIYPVSIFLAIPVHESIKQMYGILRISFDSTHKLGGARGVMVVVAGIGHGDTSSNPGLIAFHIALIPSEKV